MRANLNIAALADISRFIRMEMAVCAASIAVSGYLLFSPPGTALAWIFLAVLSGTASGYALNHMTDREEDEANSGRLSSLATSPSGWLVAVAFGAAGLCLSLLLPAFSFLAYCAALAMSCAYSLSGVKRIALLKNVYTGLAVSVVFLVGALATGPHPLALAYAAFFGAAFFVSNLAGDVRGLSGDLAAGIRTVPAIMGQEAAMAGVEAGMAFLAAVALLLGLFLTVPMMGISLLFMMRGDLPKSRLAFLGSFLPAPLSVLAWRPA
jgi:4-hydroxybenzoate polyprenyltransferase